MAITVKKLATLSGVSIRTLRYYDQIGLLKPAYYGDNQYRYYEQDQALKLQQILFYRELGFSLDEIKTMLQSDQFDQLASLRSHRKKLEASIAHSQQLIHTLNKTINHFESNTMIKLEDIFDGFSKEKQAFYVDYLIENGVSLSALEQSMQKTKTWSKQQWLDSKKEIDTIHAELVETIKSGLTPDTDAVQNLIQRHHQNTLQFWTPSRDTYITLSQMYSANRDFEAFYDSLHPSLLNFLQQAMKIYAENNLE